MYESVVEPVLRCGQCNKPFLKEATLKRHGYYCRSRKAENAPRQRSCIGCAKSKARCDKQWPNCSRCTGKDERCYYPNSAVNGPKRKRDREDDAIKSKPQRISSIGEPDSVGDTESQHEANDEEIMFDSLFGATSENNLLGWHDIDTINVLDEQVNVDGGELMQRATFPDYLTIPTAPAYNVRAFVQRSGQSSTTQRVAKLILSTLKSYPRMVTRSQTLPPHIHPRMIGDDPENGDGEYLANCINLMRMIHGGVGGSRKLFWRNVRIECERMCEEIMQHSRLNVRELLAAMQALSIYIFVRLDEGETDDNNLDSLLIRAVIVTAIQFNSYNATIFNFYDTVHPTESALSSRSLEGIWKDWIISESTRRLCAVYQILNMLVHFDPAAMCSIHMDFVLAPLPGEKRLWEANDALNWKMESDKDREVYAPMALTTNGSIVKIGQGQPFWSIEGVSSHQSLDVGTLSRGDHGEVQWEEWVSGTDSFGGLVMLVASLMT